MPGTGAGLGNDLAWLSLANCMILSLLPLIFGIFQGHLFELFWTDEFNHLVKV